MSPPEPENDPVRKGLHQLGQQMSRGAAAGAAEQPAENPVEKGLHELGRQIDEATHGPAGRRKEKGAEDGALDRARPTPPRRVVPASAPRPGREGPWHWSSC